MPDQPAFDQAKMEAFVNKVLGDTSSAFTTMLASIGDRLGLFKDRRPTAPRPALSWPPARVSTNDTPGSGSAR